MIKQYNGYEAKQSKSREVLPAGGYVAKIASAKIESYDWGDRLVIAFDIAEGDYRGFFKQDYDSNPNEDKKWRGVIRFGIPADDGSDSDAWKKRQMNNLAGALEESNEGYVWDWDESKLKGKLLGVLFRNKEWEMNGRTGWTTEACATIDVKAIREDKFKTPKDKPLNNSPAPAAPAYNEAEDTGDLPF